MPETVMKAEMAAESDDDFVSGIAESVEREYDFERPSAYYKDKYHDYPE